MAAKVIAESVKTSLGPKGMDKMLVDGFGDVTITNDGATILKEMEVQHPAAKMMVEVAKTQDDEVGDGTTTSVVVAGELLRKVAEVSLASKILSEYKNEMAELAVNAILQVAEKTGEGYRVDIDDVKVEKKPGESLADTALIKGIVLDKEIV